MNLGLLRMVLYGEFLWLHEKFARFESILRKEFDKVSISKGRISSLLLLNGHPQLPQNVLFQSPKGESHLCY